MRSRRLVDLVALALELGERVRRHLDHHVDAARQHLCHAGVGVGQGPEHHRLELGRAVPVVGIGLQDDGLVRLPLDERERPGPDGVAAEILALRLDRGRRDDGACRRGEVRQERRVGLRQGEGHRQVVRRLHRGHRREEERQRERAGIVERVALVQHPVEGELHRLGVQRRAVVEGHALAQVEPVGQSVVRDLPAFGQLRHDVQRARTRSRRGRRRC